MNTKKNTYSFLIALPITAFALLAAACGPANSSSTSQAPSDETTNALLLAEAPSQMLSVSSARTEGEPGQTIQVRGQIGGTLDPFVDGFAGFVLADPAIEFCDEMGDDEHCSTPWDACCEDPDKLQSMRVSVQFIDQNGIPLQENLQATLGLRGLDEVAVVGTVDPNSTATNMVINATGLYKW